MRKANKAALMLVGAMLMAGEEMPYTEKDPLPKTTPEPKVTPLPPGCYYFHFDKDGKWERTNNPLGFNRPVFSCKARTEASAKKKFARYVRDNHTTEQQIVDFLRLNFPEDTVCAIIDEEAMEWIDDDWQDEYEDALEWYANCGHGEAEAETRQRLAKAVNMAFSIQVEDYVDSFTGLLEDAYPAIHWPSC